MRSPTTRRTSNHRRAAETNLLTDPLQFTKQGVHRLIWQWAIGKMGCGRFGGAPLTGAFSGGHSFYGRLFARISYSSRTGRQAAGYCCPNSRICCPTTTIHNWVRHLPLFKLNLREVWRGWAVDWTIGPGIVQYFTVNGSQVGWANNRSVNDRSGREWSVNWWRN